MCGRVFLCAVSVVMAAGSAAASDITPLPGMDFSGIRIGVNVGHSHGEMGDNKAGSATLPQFPLAPTTPNEIDIDGFVGGVSLGYMHDFGHWVLGVEGDFEASGVDGSAVTLDAYNNPPDPSRASFDGNYTASMRLLLGYKVSDKTLVYATGGYEVFNVDVQIANLGGANRPIAEYDETFHGYTIGGGVEQMLTSNLSLRAEYRYSDFDTETKVLPTFADTAISGDAELHTFRAGIGYRF